MRSKEYDNMRSRLLQSADYFANHPGLHLAGDRKYRQEASEKVLQDCLAVQKIADKISLEEIAMIYYMIEFNEYIYRHMMERLWLEDAPILDDDLR
jgi:hypothetical protein